MDKTPLISVIMPVWNGEKYLAEAVDSILAQTFTDFEFVIVDDGSTDGTADILRAYHDRRLHIIREGRMGFVAAVNRAAAEARADWVARQDADDISHPARLLEQWKAIKKRPSAILCYTDCLPFGETVCAGLGQIARLPRTKALVALKACFQNPVVVGAALIKKTAFLEAGGYRAEEFPAEDYAFVSRILTLGDVVGVARQLYRIRRHDQQISQTRLEAQRRKTREVATENCQRFMHLVNMDAQKAQELLCQSPHERRWTEWWWFLTRCAPRLQWKSTESCAWLLRQSMKIFV